jgi:hypothetical protein
MAVGKYRLLHFPCLSTTDFTYSFLLKTKLLKSMKPLRFLHMTALSVLALTMILLLGSPVMAQWVRVTNGRIPATALPGGNEANGTPIYIARVSHEGGFHIGKAKQGETTAFISYGGREISLPNYEVYVGSGYWVDVRAGQTVPANTIAGGNEAGGNRLYIARATIEGGIHPGKASSTMAFIPYGGQERAISSFQALVPLGGGGLVTLYTDCAFGGASYLFNQRRYNLGQLRIPNDQLSSLKVPAGLRVVLYEDVDFGGQVRVINRDEPCLVDKTFNDLTSSLEVIETARFDPNSERCNTHSNYRDWVTYLKASPLSSAGGNMLQINATIEEGGGLTGKTRDCYFSFADGAPYPCITSIQSTVSFSTTVSRPLPAPREYKIVINMVTNTIKTISLGEGGRETVYYNCVRLGDSITGIGVSSSQRITLTITKTSYAG